MVLLHAGAETHAVSAGSIYLGSGLGLDQLDPNGRRATLVDDDPGVYLSAVDDRLWRAAWSTSTVYRYDAATNYRDLELTVSLPGGIYATSSTVFVSEHEAGGVVLLDANTGEQIGRTQLVPAADCCAVAGIESNGESLWTTVGWAKKVFRLDQTDGSVLADIDLEHHPSPVFRYANGFVWIRAATDIPEDVPEPGLIYRIDPQTNEVIPLLVDENAHLAAEIDGELWFAAGGELINVDPDTGQTIRAIELNVEGFEATEMFEAFGYVWVTAFEDPRALRLSLDEFH